MSEKKTIRINFAGFASEKHEINNVIFRILKKNFNLEISENPDFVICDSEGTHFEFMRYDCVRIMLMTENFSPDFTIFDYYVGFDYLDFGDRYFRLPYTFQFPTGTPWIPENISEEEAERIYNTKTCFCSFIYRHESSHGVREKIFDTLNHYKPIVSAGNYRNNLTGKTINITDGNFLNISVSEKLSYLEKSKFTIACESVVYPGFETEKIYHAYKTHAIPIYYGSSTIEKTFNPRSFINANSLSMDELLDKVKEIDKNKNKYIQMLMEYPFNDNSFCENLYNQFEQWLIHVFSQNPKSAFRRPKGYYVDSVNNSLKDLVYNMDKKNTPINKKLRKVKRRIIRLIK